MLNPYQTNEVVILKVKNQAPEVKSFDFKLKSGRVLEYNPGQFFVFSLAGYGESVFVPAEKLGRKNLYDITVQKIGRVTGQFHQLKVGDNFGIRGPYGNGFDLKKLKDKNLLLVAGGIGLIPVRSLIHYLINRKELDAKNRKIQLLYGCRTFGHVLFKEEIKRWKKQLDIQISLEKGGKQKIHGIGCYTGVITVLFKKADVIQGGAAILCGPPVMFKYVIDEVKKAGFKFKEEDIYLSLERRMHCAGLGTCQHCAIGPYYVCKDGPVFSYDQLKDTVQYN